MAPSDQTLSDLERSNSRSIRFQCVISRKGAKLGPMLLLNINRKPYFYIGSPISLSDLTLGDLERSESRSLRFRVVAGLHGMHVFACGLLPP